MSLLIEIDNTMYYAHEFFPSEDEFRKIATAFNDFSINGEDCDFISDPEFITRMCRKDAKLLAGKLIVSIVLNWNELTELLTDEWKKKWPVDQLKSIINAFIEELPEYSSIIDKYKK